MTQQLHAIPSSFYRIPSTRSPNVSMLVEICTCRIHTKTERHRKSATAVCFATAICFATSNIEHRTSATAVCFATAIRVKPLILFLSLWVWNSWPACLAAHVFLLLDQNLSNSCFVSMVFCDLLFPISIQHVVEPPWCL